MAAGFATLNPDLLHLCLSHVGGVDAARAGAACKHWRAVASTERLWREICVKRWPSTAKLPRAPASHLKLYKQLTRPAFRMPTVELSKLTLLVDGSFKDHRLAEVLSFADATPCDVHPRACNAHGHCHGFEWAVAALHGLSLVRDDDMYAEGNAYLCVNILRDDGKVAAPGTRPFELCDYNNGSLSWRCSLDLEHRAEAVTRFSHEWFILHVECTEGKLQVCTSYRRENPDPDAYEENTYEPLELSNVLALLDWA